MTKRIIVSVISDLVTDQRVMKECSTLKKMGFEIILIGRSSNSSFGLDSRGYKIIRLKNIFKKGMGMYLFFNMQLFFYLLFLKADILWANDLDTLLPNFLISRIKKVKLVYDSHEYFTMSVVKISSRRIWSRLEAFIFPKLKNVITVNDSIKAVYKEKYGVPVTVIRNVPYRDETIRSAEANLEGKKILIIQGVGINENRGAEEAVQMMQFLPDRFVLYFIGRGTVIPRLKQMVMDLKLEGKVEFIETLPYDEMMVYTRRSYLGLILEKIAVTDEHLFALPNRFFDYIKAGTPVLSTAAVEVKSLIEKYEIGVIINHDDPEFIAHKILEIESLPEQYEQWKQNTLIAAKLLCWENEEEVLIHFMDQLR